MTDKCLNMANCLYLLRTRNRVNQNQLAKVIGVTPPMYSRIEKGERRLKLEQLEALAEFFHVDIEELQTLWLVDKIQETTFKTPRTVTERAFSIIKSTL